LTKDDVHALEEGLKVVALHTWVARLLKQSLDNGIQRVDVGFLVNLKCLGSSVLQNLKRAKQTCQHIRDARVCLLGQLVGTDLCLEVLSKHTEKVPDDLNVDILTELRNTQEDWTQKRWRVLLLQNLEVDCERLLDDLVVNLGDATKVQAEGISLFQFTDQLLLQLTILLVLSLLAKLVELVVQLLGLFTRLVDCSGFGLIDHDVVQDEAVKQLGAHVGMVFGLQHLVHLLQDVKLKFKQAIVVFFQQVG
jgi:hypothetical protein